MARKARSLSVCLAVAVLAAVGTAGTTAFVVFTNPPREKLAGKLAEHHVAFTFAYPQTWKLDPASGKPGSANFVKVERATPKNLTIENFSVGYLSFGGPRSGLSGLARSLSRQMGGGFPQYRQVSEGDTRIGTTDGYEFRFTSHVSSKELGEVDVWGRCVLLPPVARRKGAVLVMLATSASKDVRGPQDVGQKGELAEILKSFKFTR